MKAQIQVPDYQYHKLRSLLAAKPMTLSMGLFVISILALSCLSTSIFKQQDQALAQQSIQRSQLIIHLFWAVVDRNVFIILPTSAGY